LPPFVAGEDHFARLGLPRAFAVRREDLEDHYLERAARVHPDRFAGAEPAVRRRAAEHAAALNEARRVLRDAVARAEYLLRLAGVDLDSTDSSGGAPMPSPEFLVEMIERRDRLDDVGRDPGALDAMAAAAADEVRETMNAATAALDRGDLHTAARALVARRYLARWRDEVEAARGAAGI
jgi:molecular chaperone HscB